MAKYTTENIHTVALVGHGGAGKTTLTEALLAKTGVIGSPGSAHPEIAPSASRFPSAACSHRAHDSSNGRARSPPAGSKGTTLQWRNT